MLVNPGEYDDWTVKESIDSSPIRDAKSEPKDVSYSGRTSEHGSQMPSPHLARQNDMFLNSFEQDSQGEDTTYKLEDRIAKSSTSIESVSNRKALESR